MRVLELKQQVNESTDYHLARLLLILDTFTDQETWLRGITKLVKLDFLLRYPTYLERLLVYRKKSTRGLDVAEYERQSVESSMVRYRFGPWDPRYRTWVNDMCACGLVELRLEGRTVNMRLTEAGRGVADSLRTTPEFEVTSQRVAMMHTRLGDMSASVLTKAIYGAFPALSSMRFGEEIGL